MTSRTREILIEHIHDFLHEGYAFTTRQLQHAKESDWETGARANWIERAVLGVKRGFPLETNDLEWSQIEALIEEALSLS